MKKMNVAEMYSTNAGTTYKCPFGCSKTGGYWSVYWHCLNSGCFKKNFWLSSLYYGGTIGIKLGTALKDFIKKNPLGKRYK